MSSRRKVGGAACRASLTSMEPRCASTPGAMDSTRACNRWFGKASAITVALCPTSSCSRKRSSNWATSWVGPASASCCSALPGCTICPGSTVRNRTVASVGARTVACASRAAAACVLARATASWAWAWARSVPVSALAWRWALALRCCASATSTARCNSSSREALMKPWATNWCPRRSSACAASTLASAWATPASIVTRPVVRRPCRRALACCSLATACSQAARSSSVSSSTRGAPARTVSPSRTRTDCTRPVSVAPTSTRDRVATRAVTCSVRSRGCVCAATAGTAMLRVDHHAAATARATARKARGIPQRRSLGRGCGRSGWAMDAVA